MSLVSVTEMLKKAQKEGYAVGAFNVENMEMIQAVVSAAEEMKSPAILQTTMVRITVLKNSRPTIVLHSSIRVLSAGWFQKNLS
jgi:fructose/tagatose bisphosphate aldolase